MPAACPRRMGPLPDGRDVPRDFPRTARSVALQSRSGPHDRKPAKRSSILLLSTFSKSAPRTTQDDVRPIPAPRRARSCGVRPKRAPAEFLSLRENSISAAPAPATNQPSRGAPDQHISVTVAKHLGDPLVAWPEWSREKAGHKQDEAEKRKTRRRGHGEDKDREKLGQKNQKHRMERTPPPQKHAKDVN